MTTIATGDLTEPELAAARLHTNDLLNRIVQVAGTLPVGDAATLIGDYLAIFFAYQERRITLSQRVSSIIDQRNSQANARADRAEAALLPYAEAFEAIMQYLDYEHPDDSDLATLRRRLTNIEERM